MKFFLFLLSFLLITTPLYCVRLRNLSNNILSNNTQSTPNNKLPPNNPLNINENSNQTIVHNETNLSNNNTANNKQIQNITNSANNINKNNNRFNSSNLESNNTNLSNNTKSNNNNTSIFNITNPINKINITQNGTNPLNSSIILNQTNLHNNRQLNGTNPQNKFNQSLNSSTSFNNKTMARINQILGEEGENNTVEVVGDGQKILTGTPLSQGYFEPIKNSNLFKLAKPGDKVLPRILVKGPYEVENAQKGPFLGPLHPFQGISVMTNNEKSIVNHNNRTDEKGIIQQYEAQSNETQVNLFSLSIEKNKVNNSKTIILKKNYPGIKPKSVTK